MYVIILQVFEGDGIQDDLCDFDEEGGEEGGVQWIELDKVLIKFCVGFIKIIKLFIKKVIDCV